MSRDDLVRAAGIPLGTHLLSIKTSEVKDRIEKLPRIKTARVSREFPSGLVIEVIERTPAALVPYQDGFVAVSSDGVQIEFKRPGGGIDLPVLTGMRLALYEPGKSLEGEGWARLVAVAGALVEEVRLEVSEIHLEESGEVSIYTVDGIRAIVGSDLDDLPAKLAPLPLILKDIRENSLDVIYIDLRYVGRPTVKIRQSEKKRESQGGVE